jgi:hypothetical protein
MMLLVTIPASERRLLCSVVRAAEGDVNFVPVGTCFPLKNDAGYLEYKE